MKAFSITTIFLIAVFFKGYSQANVGPGKIYGSRPDTTGVMAASKVELFMDKKPRVSVAIKGKVLKVSKSQGGWFDIDGGGGTVIHAHFTTYKVSVPTTLKGKMIIADGVAEKPMMADAGQHFAGDTADGKQRNNTKDRLKKTITFEVKGLLVL
jgi:hypothetical protein